MIVKDRYETSRDASQQLNSTFAVLNDVPVYLSHVEGWFYKIRQGKLSKDDSYKWAIPNESKDISKMDLQLEPIRLGYINDRHTSSWYFQRKPLRKWKQGLYPEYLQVKNTGKKKGFRHGFNSEFIKGILLDNGFLDMFYGKYPSFYRAYTEVRFFQKHSQAFHRDWAFVDANNENAGRPMVRPNNNGEIPPKEVLLEYKGETVGECDGPDVRLFKRFEYLTETFTEAMIHAS